MSTDSEITIDPWGKEATAWKLKSKAAKQNQDDDIWFDWQEQILAKFQEVLNQEKIDRGGAQSGGHIETIRHGQLMRIAQEIKIPGHMQRELVDSLIDDMFRKGPLEDLWSRPDVGNMQIFIPVDDEQDQIITYTDVHGRHRYPGKGFRNYRHALTWLNRHLSQMVDHFDPTSIFKDATFPNGERMHIIAPSAAAYSIFNTEERSYKFVPCLIITVRRFVQAFTLDDLTNKVAGTDSPPVFSNLRKVRRNYNRKPQYFEFVGGQADPATMDYLRIIVFLAKNHLIAGGTNAGKTTLANALTAAILAYTLLAVGEENSEMQPQCDGHVIRLKQIEGVFDLENAMKQLLRMFPDRIFIAEIRDALSYTFMRAIQSGHDGSSTTIHANSCQDAIDVAVNFAANHPSRPDRNMVRDTFNRRLHTVLHCSASKEGENWDRFFDEVVQLLPDGSLHTVMKFHKVGVDQDTGQIRGYFEFLGPTDDFVEEMFQAGIPIPESWNWN